MANKKKFDPAYINWSLYNKDRAEEILQLYYDDFKRQKADLAARLHNEYNYFFPEDYIPKALFYFESSAKDLFVPYFHVIRPTTKYQSFFSQWGQNRKYPWIDNLEENPSNSDTFRVLLSSGEIINFKGEDLGEGMAGQKEIIISNGDTQDYARLDFETFSEQGKVIKSFLDLVLAKDARIFDFKRKCWFIKSEVVEPLLLGFRKLIDQGTLLNYSITDKREIIEDFEDFFHSQEELQAPPAKDKATCLKEFMELLSIAQVQYSMPSTIVMSDVKPYYRKAALFYHPDRNNGDGSKMAQLNVVWTQLQEYLK